MPPLATALPPDARRPVCAGWRAALLLMATAAAAASNTAWAQVFTKSATPWPEIPQPPRSQVQWVSADMQVNGIPVKVQSFSSAASLEEVVAHYEAHWDQLDPTTIPEIRGRKKGVMVSRPNVDTAIIGKFHGPFYMTVKVKRAGLGTSTGALSTSFMEGKKPVLEVRDVPHPSGAKPVSVVESADAGHLSKTVIFVSDEAAPQIEFFYSRGLVSSGWTLMDKYGSDRLENGNAGYVLMLRKGQEQLDVVVAQVPEQRRSTFRVNWVHGGQDAK
ncbi:MAG: hypothetical protein LBP52_04580 [Burkholderiaceae bacterium]|nr:hypothetical protein [Burkholderiaceae bacterium]